MALAPFASAQNEAPPTQPATPPAVEQPASEPPASDLPSAESLFEKHLDAIGGRDKVLAFTSRRASGTVKVYASGQAQPVQSGIVRLQANASGTYVQEVIFPGQSTVIRAFDGKAGWVVEADKAPRSMQLEELDRMVVASRFHADADYATHFKAMRTLDKQPLNGGDSAYIVEVTHFSGRTEAYIFSETSGLILGVIGVRLTGPDQETEFRRSYEEYTDFGDGVRIPKIVREILGTYMVEMTFTSVETNTDFPDPARPEGIPDADLSPFQK